VSTITATTRSWSRGVSPDRRLAGRASEEEAQARYHERRDAHVLADWTECTSLARDLSQLATA